jgi:hypothetical protein
MGVLKNHLEIIRKTLDEVWCNEDIFFMGVVIEKNG